MTTGLVLFALGGIGLMASIFFAWADKVKTGVLFRRKGVVVAAFIFGALGLVGMLVVFLSQQT